MHRAQLLLLLLHVAVQGGVKAQNVAPGDAAESFVVVGRTGSSNLTVDADLPTPNATLFLVLDNTDPFTTYMINAPSSLAMFLQEASLVSRYAFVPLNAEAIPAVAALQERFQTAIANLQPDSLKSSWQVPGRLVFGAEPLATMAPLNATMASWPSPRSVVGAAGEVFPRLDCLYAWCAWPEDGTGANLTANVPQPCTAPKATLANEVWLVFQDHLTCSLSDLFRNANLAGLQGLVLVDSANATYVSVVGDQVAADADPGNLMVTSVSFATGSQLARLAGSGSLVLGFDTLQGMGLMAGIDAQGFWVEMGWEKYPFLMMLGWQALYQEYLQELHYNLSLPAFVIPVMDRLPMHGSPGALATVAMPPALSATFNSMDLDMALTCPGHTDADCPIWDHTVQLFVCCNASDGAPTASCGSELGRWITPFRRRIGRWLTPVTPLMPLLSNAATCTFNLQTAPWAMPWAVSLNLRLNTLPAPAPNAPTVLVPLFAGGTFDASYNNRSVLQVTIPTQLVRAQLEAVITGHGSDNNGCGEFCPTSHHFLVNGDAYVVTFAEAGTPFGCANKTRQGAEPNEHGTWYYGRNGWCDGQEVRPWVVDVTRSVHPGQNASLQYFGWYDGHTPAPTESPGIIIMSSNLVLTVP